MLHVVNQVAIFGNYYHEKPAPYEARYLTYVVFIYLLS